MKFDCGDTWEEYQKKQDKWHDFFTILPRRVGSHDCRWFETIQRRRHISYSLYGTAYWKTEYRAKEKK